MRIAAIATLLAASVVTTVLSLVLLPFNATRVVEPLVWFTAALWALFAASVFMLRRVPTRAAIVLVMVGAVAIGGASLAGPPNTSTDSARYAWDGIVQRAGISPYEYAPADPALSALRTDWLSPPPVDGECVGQRIMTFEEPGTGNVLCSAINRLTVPTIYAPTAELYFAATRLIAGPDATYLPSQVGGLLLSLAVTALLLRTLLRLGRDPRWAAMWAWCPLVATEAITNSHVDALSALLLLLATALVGSKRQWLGGLALGAATAVKLIPAIGGAAILRWRVVVGAVVAFAVLYVPYVLLSGIDVLGFLPGYLGEEGYGSGKRFILFTLFAPGPVATILAALVIVATVALVVWKSDPANPWLGQVVLIGVVLLVLSPRYAWYALLLVPMIAMSGRWEWLAVPLALTERLLVKDPTIGRISIFLSIVFIVAISVRRMTPEARKHWDPRRLTRRFVPRLGAKNR